jgi:hypothetical protein
MNLIMLVQDEHKPIPDNIKVIWNFGREHIRSNDGRSYCGESTYLQGEPQAFKEWLRPFDGFWVSNNPMVGDWHIEHVREEA